MFEITETAVAGNLNAARTFGMRMRALGCAVALDDFGVGQGTFTYLKHLRVDYLKIHMQFMRNLLQDDEDRQIVQAIIGVARQFKIETIAEGVEDQPALEELRRLGVDYAQGYWIGRPVPLAPPLAIPINDVKETRMADQSNDQVRSEELAREQSLTELEQALGDREQLAADRDQSRIDHEQVRHDQQRDGAAQDDQPSHLLDDRQARIDREQVARDVSQEALDLAQEGRDDQQEALDDKRETLALPTSAQPEVGGRKEELPRENVPASSSLANIVRASRRRSSSSGSRSRRRRTTLL